MISHKNTKKSAPIEIKSTKGNKIPGSSIQQVDPFEWVIFIQRKNNQIKLTTGMYLNAITNRLPFPDRSPRPEVAFETLKKWNTQHIAASDEQLVLIYDTQDLHQKSLILSDWKLKLADDWLAFLKNNEIKSHKWFDEALVHFAKALIDYYLHLGDNDKNIFYEKLVAFIVENHAEKTE